MFAAVQPIRCRTDGRLHSGPPPAVHSPNPFTNPPTGTPKNGKRTARQLAVNEGRSQTHPPPAHTHAPVIRERRFVTAVVLPATPSSDHSRTTTTTTPGAPLRPRLQADAADDLDLNIDPIPFDPRGFDSPSPANTTTAMNALRNPPAFTLPSAPTPSAASPTSTILVPETPEEHQRTNHALATQHIQQIDAENNTVAALRASRARLVEQLNDMTALVDRLRLRQQITELDRLHEAQLAGASRTAGWKTPAFWTILVVVGAYAAWCQYNAVDIAYVRQRNCLWYGLPQDC